MLRAICIGFLVTSCAIAGDDPPPPGKLIDLGGYRLHLYCTGKGKQAVVLSPGAGDFSFVWYLVQRKITAYARVCSYDRADNAWSDPGPRPRTLRQEAYEVHLAMERAKEPGPYILVGHSMGGLAMRVFAERYPSETAGLVLVDATSPDTTLGYQGRLVHMRELAADRPIPDVHTMSTSPPQLLDKPGDPSPARISPPFDRLPLAIQQLQRWARSRPRRAAPGEDYLPEELKELYERSSAPHPLGDRPLITIVALRNDPAPRGVAREEWDRLFEEKLAQKRGYAGLSTNSRVADDPKAGHTVQLDDPAAVVTAIRDVLKAVRQHTQLKP